MEQQMQAASLQLDKLQNTLQDTHLQISQIKGLFCETIFKKYYRSRELY